MTTVRHEQLDTLMEELSEESVGESPVKSGEDSYALIQIFDTDEEIRLNRQQCLAVFRDTDTVNQLIEALGLVEDDSVVLHSLKLPGQVLDSMETYFTAIDEA